MDLKKLFDLKNSYTGKTGLFSIYGDFGIVDGTNDDIQRITEVKNGYKAEYDDFTALCEFEEHENGVIFRQDFLTAKKDITLNKFASRFLLEGGDYEVYTQSSSWQNESIGGWQPLITGIEISNIGLRTTDGATPMAVIRNKGNGKMLVIHLMPNAMWKIRISKLPAINQFMGVLIETGINDCGLNMHIEKGETVEMPRLIMYEAQSMLDFDAWKLHTVFNRLYPRKPLPVMYNTWMLHFDTIDIENIYKQIDCAAELGIEQFLIDAGWFGTGSEWWTEIGVWQENLKGGFKGHFKELSDYVRAKGMKFGFWLEPERALTVTESYKAHPQFYITDGGSAFLDYSNDDACKYITDITLNLIEKYNAQCLKFDFNASLAFDKSGNGFYRYFKGVRKFLANIKAHYPDIFITNCASGGNRMELENGMYYDSIWSSDNQSPIYGFRIFKDSALRLPPCHIEKWDVRRFFDGFPQYGNTEFVSLPISCNGATWDNVLNVKSEYTHGFLTGGPIGFSTDIASYPESEKEALKAHIAKYKDEREFYRNATMRILHDTADLTVIEYADTEFKKIKIQIFTNVLKQAYVNIYPVLDDDAVYFVGEEEICGKTLSEKGITAEISDINCKTFDIMKK